eukprot:scaffold3795_cov126-Isochrysis_galbana.AAC.10
MVRVDLYHAGIIRPCRHDLAQHRAALTEVLGQSARVDPVKSRHLRHTASGMSGPRKGRAKRRRPEGVTGILPAGGFAVAHAARSPGGGIERLREGD